jgi:hypothetical protein
MDATVDAGTGGDPADADNLDTGVFDVVILYADRELPDIAAPAMNKDGGSAEGGWPWPNCPAFLPVGAATDYTDEIPAIYVGDGGDAAAAPDGSPCATYGWLGSPAIDECVISQTLSPETTGSGTYSELPPCNWCSTAGVAVQGSGAGISLYTLCLDLYACAMSTGCYTNIESCFCGPTFGTPCTQNPTGPCLAQEMAALQELPAAFSQAIGKDFTQTNPNSLAFCAGQLNSLFQHGDILGNKGTPCFPPYDGGGD